jgi:hypothetical protein
MTLTPTIWNEIFGVPHYYFTEQTLRSEFSAFEIQNIMKMQPRTFVCLP